MQGNRIIPALVISLTIIAMLVIAAIAIRGATSNGLINDVDDTTIKYVQTQEESTLRMQVSQWQMSSRLTTTLEVYLKKEYGDNKVEVNRDKSFTVETKTGNRFNVKESGEVTLVK